MENEICGNELNFLMYKLPFGGGFVKDCLLSSAVFYNHFVEIKRRGIHIDGTLVYQELEKMLFPIIREESKYRCREDFKDAYVEENGLEAYQTLHKDYLGFRRALRKLSEDLYGDKRQWELDYENEYGEAYTDFILRTRVEIPPENEDLAYILETCSQLKPTSLGKLLTEELTVKAFRKAGKITDIYYAYEVFKPVFFRCVRLGYKNKEEKRGTYYKLRSIAEDFCNVLYSDKTHWHEDYAAWAAENEVS